MKGHDETGTSTKVVTTDATGVITIKGLKEGTYYLHETAAPTGFNKLTRPIKIQITAGTGDLRQFTYNVNGKDPQHRNGCCRLHLGQNCGSSG